MFMNLLFTGASGFLGNSVLPLLKEKYTVFTIGLTQEDYVVNLAQDIPHLFEVYDVVLHAAGKAHFVPRTEIEKKMFFDINLQGTKNLCTALERSGVPKAFIFISTVAVYGCENGELITEDHPLNGTTPYAKSKIQAENYLQNWCAKYDVLLSIIRPSLIAGPRPPGNLGAMIHGIKSGNYARIAGGKARKSVLMVQDIANLVPLLVEKGGVYNVCDTHHPSFFELETIICKQLDKNVLFSIPNWLAKLIAVIGDCCGELVPMNSPKFEKMTKSLTFSNAKALQELGWKPMNVLDNFRIE